MSSERASKKKRPLEQQGYSNPVEEAANGSDALLVHYSGDRNDNNNHRMSFLSGLNDPSSTCSPSTNITILHQQQQIEGLQAELEHERTARQLDVKKHKLQVHRLEAQIVLVTEEAEQARALLNDREAQTKRRIKQLTLSQNQALDLNRELNLRLRNFERHHDEHEELSYRQRYEHCQKELRELRNMDIKYQNEIHELKQQVQTKLDHSAEVAAASLSSTAAADLKLLEEAPAAVLQELNRCRIELAERERQCRQLHSKYDETSTRNRQLIRDNEKLQQQSKKLPQVQTDYDRLYRSHQQVQADNTSWKEFGNQLKTTLQMTTSSSTDHAADGGAGPPEMATVLRFLENTKREQETAKNDVTRYKNQCKQLKSQLVELQSGKDRQVESDLQWTAKERKWQVELDTVVKKLQTSQQQATLYQREAESMRTLIQTFEKQQKMSGSKGGSGTISSNNNNTDPTGQTLRVQLQSVQEQLKGLGEERTSLLAELQTTKSEKADHINELDRIKSKYDKLRNALVLEKDKVTAAEQRAVEAEQLAGKGTFDPKRTRVLHFSETPLVLALKEEVQVLKRQLDAATASAQKMMKKTKTPSSGAKVADLPPMPVSAADPDKLNQRLKENFKEQIALFREAIYLMTGFKVDMLTNTERPTFRLRSVFAEKEEDQLLLQWPKKSKGKDESVSSLDILNTDLAKMLSSTPSYDYMTKFHSLPAFLASVQLSLFEKQTIVM